MSKKSYDHKDLQKKWAKNWYKDNIYKAEDFSDKPKKYILAEFPYPSGKSLHVGHMMRYTVPDAYTRFLRMKGYNVMFPMGWDAFGLPAELHAIKTGTHPKETIADITKGTRELFKEMGYGFDWDREINTTDPNYYKWTQWIFLQFYKAGLAEYQEMPVWWAKELGVLADEEVLTDKDGNKISERGSYPVERKMKRQWVMKIPLYAEKLLEGLDEVEWPEPIKMAQRNWIGKKTGMNITYQVEGTSESVTVFTTRPDTNFGATFVAISPEHKLVDNLKDNSEVQNYVKQAKTKSELERLAEGKKKTGVFTGLYAINPLNNYKMPIWVADFVLPSFGTGALVGVPAHDQRDFEFAKEFNLEIKKVISSDEEIYEGYDGQMINSDFLNGLSPNDAIEKIMQHIEKEGYGERVTHYNIRDWVFSRQRYWGEPIPLMHREDGKIEAVPEDELPVTLPEVDDFNPLPDGTSPIAKNEEWLNVKAEDGTPAKREIDTMPNWAGSSWYFLRYIDPKNDNEFADKKKLEYWMPVDHYFGGSEHTTLHLLYSRFWNQFLYDQGHVPVKEPYTKRTNGGLLLGPDGRKMSKSLGNVIDPMAIVEKYGADALRMYIAFIGPYTDTYPWNDDGVKATYKLLQNLYLYQEKVNDVKPSEEMSVAYHTLLKNVTDMYDSLKMNTAVSEIMKFMNLLKKEQNISKEIWLGLLQVIAPLSPFVTEELWQITHGNKEWKPGNSIHLTEWPKYDEDVLQSETMNIPVQVNGKYKTTITVAHDESDQNIEVVALNNPKIAAILNGQKPKKFIYVSNKVINIVV